MPKIKAQQKKNNGMFKTILLAKRAELVERIEQYRSEMQCERDADDETAVALLSVEKDLAVTNLGRAMRTLTEVEAALHSMDQGGYGYCARCEERISYARLRALPWTRVCIDCAEGGMPPMPIRGEHVHAHVMMSAPRSKAIRTEERSSSR